MEHKYKEFEQTCFDWTPSPLPLTTCLTTGVSSCKREVNYTKSGDKT